MSEMTFTRAPALLKLARIRDVLRREYMTIPELAKEIALSETWTRAYLKKLRQDKLVHIYEWRHIQYACREDWIPAFAAGEATDAPKPARATLDKADYYRKRYKIRKEEDPLAHEAFLAKRRNARWTPTCDVAASWIPRRT